MWRQLLCLRYTTNSEIALTSTLYFVTSVSKFDVHIAHYEKRNALPHLKCSNLDLKHSCFHRKTVPHLNCNAIFIFCENESKSTSKYGELIKMLEFHIDSIPQCVGHVFEQAIGIPTRSNVITISTIKFSIHTRLTS